MPWKCKKGRSDYQRLPLGCASRFAQARTLRWVKYDRSAEALQF
jgi:hypothetical protein